MQITPKYTLRAVLVLFILLFCMPASAAELPGGFVYLKEVIPDIEIELRYYTENNFVGQRIDGYLKPKCILSKKTALALRKVQVDLKRFGLGLKVYDAYRPQRAVDHFVRWAKDLNDTKNKARYYPDVAKENLFKEGYIASKSGHTRGSTVDLTIIDLASKKELDMGAPWDFFSSESWPICPDKTPSQRANRLLLQMVMNKYGFKQYDKEWWHFTLRDEPFPDRYFDFIVE